MKRISLFHKHVSEWKHSVWSSLLLLFSHCVYPSVHAIYRLFQILVFVSFTLGENCCYLANKNILKNSNVYYYLLRSMYSYLEINGKFWYSFILSKLWLQSLWFSLQDSWYGKSRGLKKLSKTDFWVLGSKHSLLHHWMRRGCVCKSCTPLIVIVTIYIADLCIYVYMYYYRHPTHPTHLPYTHPTPPCPRLYVFIAIPRTNYNMYIFITHARFPIRAFSSVH